MAQPSFEAFLWSLTQQESGGRYNAVGVWVNGDRAYGRYQVMGRNVPSWTKKYYGRSLTPAQFLANHAAQDAVVRGVLGGYYKKYGAAGAAAMWYSGQSNPNKTYGNPPVYKYVQSVLNRAKGYKGGSGSSATSGGVVPRLDDATLAQTYGLSLSLINSDKELKKLFKQAVREGWKGTLFTAHLKETSWWKRQSASLRKYVTNKYLDPASFRESRLAAGAAIKVMAISVGLTNTDLVKDGHWTDLLNDLIYKKLALGWTDARLKNYMGAKTSMHGGVMYGDAGEAFDKLHEAAYLNGVNYNSSTFQAKARAIVAGTSTLEAETAEIRKAAAAKYTAWSQQILAGQSAMDLAASYIKSVSSLLELPETGIDLDNRWVNKAMTGGKPDQPYSIWQFENDVRSDPLWNKTNNARESMFGTARQVLRDFGLAY